MVRREAKENKDGWMSSGNIDMEFHDSGIAESIVISHPAPSLTFRNQINSERIPLCFHRHRAHTSKQHDGVPLSEHIFHLLPKLQQSPTFNMEDP